MSCQEERHKKTAAKNTPERRNALETTKNPQQEKMDIEKRKTKGKMGLQKIPSLVDRKRGRKQPSDGKVVEKVTLIAHRQGTQKQKTLGKDGEPFRKSSEKSG